MKKKKNPRTPRNKAELSTLFNTLPQRTARINSQDLEAIKGQLTLEFSDAAVGGKRDTRDFWNKRIPYTPQQILRVLNEGLPKDTKISFQQIDLNDGTFDLTIKSEETGIDFDTSFNFKRKHASAGSYTVDDAHQAKKLGRTVLRNKIEFLHACGAKNLKIYAASTRGGYVWAKLGFLPESIESVRDNIGSDIKERYKKIRRYLPEEQKIKMDSAIKLNKKEDLWIIADCDIDLKSVIRNKNHDALRNAEDNRPYRVGYYLLAGTSWNGIMKFSNKKQMERVGDYVGGWRYLKQEPA